MGRTDQVPFVSLGIPGYGVLGAYDSTPTENPYPWWYKNKPPIPQYADTTRCATGSRSSTSGRRAPRTDCVASPTPVSA